jgi:hypothetical protein
MRIGIALAMLPVAAHAMLPAAAHAELIFVDYEGVVLYLKNDPPTSYGVGDRFAGRLTIDTVLAGPDREPEDSNYGFYGTYAVDFVTGYLPFSDGVTDRVGVRHDTASLDYFGLDSFIVADSRNAGRADEHQLIIAAFDREIVNDDGIVQSFELRPSSNHSDRSLSAALQWGFSAVQEVAVSLTRLSVRPASCFP